MKSLTQILSAKRDKLKTSARAATKLAAVERTLADQQHAVARDLEILADGLSEQVIAVETEMLESVPLRVVK